MPDGLHNLHRQHTHRHDGVSLSHAFDGHLTLPPSSSSSSAGEEEEEEEGEQLDLAWGIRQGYLCDILGGCEGRGYIYPSARICLGAFVRSSVRLSGPH